MTDLLLAREVAQLKGVTTQTVARAARLGRLTYVMRLYRGGLARHFKKEDVEQWVPGVQDNWAPRNSSGEKWCRECDQYLPLDKFPKHGGGYRKSICAECHSFVQRARIYGISTARVRELSDQECAISICHDSATDIDHCHVTGVVRDGLCGRHNRALANLRDSPEEAYALAEYLKRHADV